MKINLWKILQQFFDKFILFTLTVYNLNDQDILLDYNTLKEKSLMMVMISPKHVAKVE